MGIKVTMFHVSLLDPVCIILQLIYFNLSVMEKERNETECILFLVDQIILKITFIQCFGTDKVKLFDLDLFAFIDIKSDRYSIFSYRLGSDLNDRIIVPFSFKGRLHCFLGSLYTHFIIQVTFFDPDTFKKLFPVITIACHFDLRNSPFFIEVVDQCTTLLLYPYIFKITLIEKVLDRLIDLFTCDIVSGTDPRNFICNTF